jgi:polyisoprenoid-binding protein YceI
MKTIIAIVLMAVMALGADLKVDKELLFISVDGNFSDFSGVISVEGDMITAINGVVTVLSLDTDNARRDDHLLSSDFFDEVAYKSIIFKSTKITDDSVVADITIKNITKSITFRMKKIDVSENGVKIKLTAVVDRTEFDIDNNFMSSIIFDNIDVTSTLVAK